MLTVRFQLPGEPLVDLANVPVVQGRETGLAQTAIRGFVRDAKGRPLAGATIQVGGAPGEAKTGPAGDWFFYFDLNRVSGTVAVTATLPDGRSQNQNHAVVARAITAAPAFVFP